jgi:hypothetical protein
VEVSWPLAIFDARARACAKAAARGPRQQVVASLGKLDERELSGLRGGW